MEVSMPFAFSYEVSSPPLDEMDLEFRQALAEVLTGDFFFIKVHVLYRIICSTPQQLQQLPEDVGYYETPYYTDTFLSYQELLESDLCSDLPAAIVPRELMQSMMPEVMSRARNLCETPRTDSNGETDGCRLFNLVLDIDVDALYDDEVVNMVMEESAEEIRMVPASKSAIDSIKKVNLGKDICKEECSICLVEFVEGEEVSVMPCNHMFHQECITQWLQRSGMCPLCRYSMSQNSS